MRSKEKNSKKKKRKVTWVDCLFIAILLVGAGILGYPTFANWWNSYTASGVASSYETMIEELDTSERDAWLKEAQEYNQKLATYASAPGLLSDQEKAEYNALLGGPDQKVIGVLEVPSINVSLPIMKGTDEEVLLKNVGHLEGSSLPVGGIGTHAVLSGHRGLPSMKLLSDLDQVSEGDVFTIKSLGETLTYQVDAIHVVEPEDLHFLAIDSSKDLVTLVTCTPYGVNTHRLLVRGHRVSNALDLSKANPDAKLVNRLSVALWIGIPGMILIVVIWMVVSGKRKKAVPDDVDFDEFDDDNLI